MVDSLGLYRGLGAILGARDGLGDGLEYLDGPGGGGLEDKLGGRDGLGGGLGDELGDGLGAGLFEQLEIIIDDGLARVCGVTGKKLDKDLDLDTSLSNA